MQAHVEKKNQENRNLQQKITEHAYRLSNSLQTNENLRFTLQSKERDYLKMHNELKIMGIDAKSKQDMLNSLRNNRDALKSACDDKTKALVEIEAELEAIKKATFDPEQHEKSKEKYKALLTRFEKTVDEKILAVDKFKEIEKERDTLLLSNSSLKTQYETILAQETVDNSEAIKADKEKYNKLLDRFEKLTDRKNAIVHEKLKMEQAFKTSMNNQDIEKLKEEHAELQQKLQKLESEVAQKVEESSKFKVENAELKKKSKELGGAQVALEKITAEMKEVKKEHIKVLVNMKANNLKLYTQKEKVVTELKSLKKSRLENSTAVESLGIGSVDDSMDYNELEKKYLEVKTARNRLIRESNRNKQRGDNLANDNTKLIEKIKRLEATNVKLEEDLSLSQNKNAYTKSVMESAKQEEMIHQ